MKKDRHTTLEIDDHFRMKKKEFCDIKYEFDHNNSFLLSFFNRKIGIKWEKS